MRCINSITPKWVHDCDRCIFLGTYQFAVQHIDLYYCPALSGADGKTGGGSVLARYSDDGPDYESCRVGLIADRTVTIEYLVKAFEIAYREKGLFSIEIREV